MTNELKFELPFPYDIQIQPTVNGGCIVRVGCATLSYSNTNKMITDLRKYLADPEAHEKAYNECQRNRPVEVASDRPETPRVHGSGRALGQPLSEAGAERRDPTADTDLDPPNEEASDAQTENAADQGEQPGHDR